MFFLLRYKQCFEEAMNGFEEVYLREKGVNRDDRIHGSLLVLNELLRCSNSEWEHTFNEINSLIQAPSQHLVLKFNLNELSLFVHFLYILILSTSATGFFIISCKYSI